MKTASMNYRCCFGYRPFDGVYVFAYWLPYYDGLLIPLYRIFDTFEIKEMISLIGYLQMWEEILYVAIPF